MNLQSFFGTFLLLFLCLQFSVIGFSNFYYNKVDSEVNHEVFEQELSNFLDKHREDLTVNLILGNRGHLADKLEEFKEKGIYTELHTSDLMLSNFERDKKDLHVIERRLEFNGKSYGKIRLGKKVATLFRNVQKQVLFFSFIQIAVIVVVTISFYYWLNRFLITPLKRNLKNLEQGQEEPAALGPFVPMEIIGINRNFQSLAVELQRKKVEESLVKVAGQVAHDIRSPLAAITYVASTFKDKDNEAAGILQEASSRLSEIASDLLESHRLQGDPENECLAVPALKELVRQKQFETSFELRTQFAPAALDFPAAVDPVIFSRVMSNLLNNAVEAQATPVVRIEAFTTGDELVVVLEDQGPGFPDFILQGKFVSTKASGNGLGLSFLASCAKKFNFKFDLANTGTGARVTLTFGKRAASVFATAQDLSSSMIHLSEDHTQLAALGQGKEPVVIASTHFNSRQMQEACRRYRFKLVPREA